MSLKLLTKVFSESKTKGGGRLVLLALADTANDDGLCWPSVNTIADKANIKPQYVRDWLAAFVAAGLLRREERPGKSTMYYIAVGMIGQDDISRSTAPTPPPYREGLENLTPPPYGEATPPPYGEATPPPYGEGNSQLTVNEPSLISGGVSVHDFYMQNFPGMLTPFIAESLTDLVKDYTAEWVVDAMKIAVRNNAKTLNYVERVLQNRASGKERPAPKTDKPKAKNWRTQK